ncbi:hypothetical protein UlMin_000365 [Ulmus minor]
MPKLSVGSKLAKWRGVQRPILILGTLAIIVTFVTFSKFYFLGSLLVVDSFCNQEHTNIKSMTRNQVQETIGIVVQKIQTEIDDIRNSQTTSYDSSLKFHSFLADILGLIESFQASLPKIEAIFEPNGTFTSIGHACFAMKKELEEYMDYDIGEICNEDWKLAQKLMVHGCDPLPRRRCFSPAPKLYSKPFPLNESIWKLPDNRNVRWSQYKCKNFACLATNSTGKGFFKCAYCFNISHHELPRWIKQENLNSNLNLSADFLTHQVLDIKPGEIRIGLKRKEKKEKERK